MAAKARSNAKAPARDPLAGRKARVCLERGGLMVEVQDVDAADAMSVADAMLDAFRVLCKAHPVLLPFPEVVPGGSPVYVPDEDDDYEDRKRGIGFTA